MADLREALERVLVSSPAAIQLLQQVYQALGPAADQHIENPFYNAVTLRNAFGVAGVPVWRALPPLFRDAFYRLAQLNLQQARVLFTALLNIIHLYDDNLEMMDGDEN